MTSILLALLLADPTPIQVRADEPVAAARAVITDQFGNPPPEQMPLGELLVFSARNSVRGEAPTSVKWTILPPERDSRKWVPQGSTLDVAVPTGQKPVTITVILSVAKGDTVDHTMLMVRCGEGDIPPPDPKPDPRPKPDPTPPNDRALTLAIVDDITQRSVETAIVMNNLDYWQGLTKRGHKWRFYDVTSGEADGRTAATDAKARGYPANGRPAIVIRDSNTNSLVAVQPLPKSTAEIDSLLKGFTSR